MVNDILKSIRQGSIDPEKAVQLLRDSREKSDSVSWQEKFQKDLAQIVCELLKIENSVIDMEASVSDLGLDSLSATEFNNHIRSQFGVNLQATAFFECNTLKDFYHYLCNLHTEKIIKYYNPDNSAHKIVESVFSVDSKKVLNSQSADPIRTRLDELWHEMEKTLNKDNNQYTLSQATYLQCRRAGNSSVSVITAGQGEPLLLLGGLMNPEGIWHKQVNRLAQHYRVIIFNKPGVGGSELDRKKLSIEYIIDHIDFVLKALAVTNPINIIGFSFGGMLAQQFSCHFPDKVKRMVLINTTVRKSERINNVDVLRKEVSHCPEVVEINGNIDFSVATMYGEISNRVDMRDYIATCTIPTLVLSGSDDQYIASSQAEELASLLPHAIHKIISGARHFSLLTHSNEVNQNIIEFLTE